MNIAHLKSRLLRNLGATANIMAHDPVAEHEARCVLELDLADAPALLANLQFADKAMESVQGTNALTIVTEWESYRSPNWTALKAAMKAPVLLDGRNLYESQNLQSAGFN